jgi:hypothetical protein
MERTGRLRLERRGDAEFDGGHQRHHRTQDTLTVTGSSTLSGALGVTTHGGTQSGATLESLGMPTPPRSSTLTSRAAPHSPLGVTGTTTLTQGRWQERRSNARFAAGPAYTRSKFLASRATPRSRVLWA